MGKLFSELGLKEELLKALQEMGYEQATPIQEQVIEAFSNHKHIVGQSQTGTGKTAAFVLPMLNSLDAQVKKIQAVVLVPTRELAVQTQEEFFNLGKHTRIRALAAYGGRSIGFQQKLLDQGMHVAVCTPGRAIDLIERKILKLDTVKYLILDEVDRMLDMGFLDDVEWIWSQMPKLEQIMCFSATMPKQVISLLERHIGREYTHLKTSQEIVVDKIDHAFIDAPHISKRTMLDHWLKSHLDNKTIIFSQTKQTTRDLANYLRTQKYNVGELHGDIEQRDRTRTLKAYKAGDIDILVATDVASRGLNMNDIDLVVNYDVPQDPEDYVHRIGRTARAGKSGKAITFVDGNEIKSIHAIERTNKITIKRVNQDGVEQTRTDKRSSGGRDGFSSSRRWDSSRRTGGIRANRSFGSNDRSNDRGGSDRPARSFSDRPARSFSDRPARSSFGDRPARSDDRPTRSFSDRPARSFSDRPARSFSGGSAGRSSQGDSRSGGNTGERRSFGSRRFGDTGSSQGGDRGPRSGGGSSSAGGRRFGSNDRSSSSDRPARSFGDRPARGGSTGGASRFGSRDSNSAPRKSFGGGRRSER